MSAASIESTRFGTVEVAEDSVIDFPEGLIGRADLHRFAILEPKVGRSPFRWLLSLDEPEVGFAIADPSKLFADYNVDLTEEIAVLGIEDPKEVQLYVILGVPEDPIRTTANLLAPIVINPSRRLARQLVLSDSRYSTRHAIIASRPAN